MGFEFGWNNRKSPKATPETTPEPEASFTDEKGKSIFGEVENQAPKREGWKMPTIAERRKDLQETAMKAYNGEKISGSMPARIAQYNEYGFRDTYGGEKKIPEHVNAHGLRGVLGRAAYDAEVAFKKVQKGDKEALTQAQTIAPKELNHKYARDIAELVYPTTYTGNQDHDGETIVAEEVKNVESFIKEKMNLATIAEVTARQLGMEVPENFSPAKTYEVIAGSLGEGEYGLGELREFMSRNEPALTDEREIILTDMLLRLANSTWAAGQVAVAQLTEKPARLQRDTFDSPEGRQQEKYKAAKEKFGEETAFYVAVFENAKDKLQYL